MVTVAAKIRKWAAGLPYWEQLAFKKVLDGEELTDKDYGELIDLFLEDNGVKEKTSTRYEIFGDAKDEEEDEELKKEAIITRLFDVSNVNALLEGQEIRFSPQITVLFGHNRTGKTGYFRVLACSAHQRGKREILPDVYEPESDDEAPSAKIEIEYDGDRKLIELKPIEENAELSCFYVYDALTEDIHITRDTPVEFVPRALVDLKSLSDVYDRVLDGLRKIINEKRKTNEFVRLFREDTEVGLSISNLSYGADLDFLRSAAELSEKETSRVEILEKKIGNLRGLDVNEAISRLNGEIKDLGVLKSQLELIKERLNENEGNEIEELTTRAVALEKELRETGLKQFESDYFEHIGSEEWLLFVRAADSLGKKESEGREQYPQEDDFCLFCRQPLTMEAISFIRSLWGYLRTDLQIELAGIKEKLDSKRRGIEVVKIPMVDFEEDSAGFRVLEIGAPERSKELGEFLKRHHDFQVAVLGYIATGEKPTLPGLPHFDITHIGSLISERETRIKTLEKDKLDAKLKTLKQEYNEINDRLVLKENFNNISKFVNDLKIANVISDNMGSTKHITQKRSELSRELITNQYAGYFGKVLKKLGCDVKVRIGTKGEKGEQKKFITLDTPVDISESGYKIREILSEGERRAVTLADFLTEVVLNENCTGMILDDPTTGMDRIFKENTADLFVALAKKKQVVIFTHDLVFLSFIHKSTKKYDCELVSQWVKRGGDGDEPGYVTEGDPRSYEYLYKSSRIAQDYYALAKKKDGSARDDLLREGFEALRRSYEILIVNGIINNVISRWDERVMYSMVKEVVGREDILHAIYEKYEYLSGFIKGHSHSPEFDDIELTPPMLFSEIEFFEQVRDEIREWKKVLSAQAPVPFQTKFPK